jgi:hypothetical protein
VRHRLTLALLLCAALIGAACSSEDDDANAGGSDSDATELPVGHPIQGITDTEIKIGIPHFPLNAVDMSTLWEASLKQAREDGRLPVHGRDITPVYELIDTSSAAALAESYRGACVKFADEEKAFMVMGAGINSLVFAQCLATERKLITWYGGGRIPNDDLFAQTDPFLFVNNMSSSKTLRNWPHWADDEGFLEDKKIGLVRADDPLVQAEIDRFFKPQLEDLGFRLSEEVLFTDATSVPGIVQRLKASGVETVFLNANAALVPFSLEMEAQNYHPEVLVTEHDNTAMTASVPRDTIPASFRATGMSAYHRAMDEVAGNPAGPDEQQECIQTYAKWYGVTFVEFSGGRPTANYSNFHLIQHVCDTVNMLLDTLEEIGPDLTPTSLVRGIEAVKNVKSGEVLDISFAPGDHSGSDQVKTIEWNPACNCWSHVSEPRDVYVE